MTSHDLVQLATQLATAVDGFDWNADLTHECLQAILKAHPLATPEARSAALEVLVERIQRSQIDDADGVAQVAINAGTLVENGAPALPLAEALLAKVPAIWVAARRYADVCLAALGPLGEDGEESHEGVTTVDGRSIPRDLFRAHLDDDRPGAVALAYLKLWTLACVAALSRCPPLLARAANDKALRDKAGAMRDSDAYWLDLLLGVELGASWLVLCPTLERGFWVRVDGVVSNFDLHALLAHTLLERGLPGKGNPPDVIAYIRGEAQSCQGNQVLGTFNLYDWRAANSNLSEPNTVSQSTWVWGEGQPRDVPRLDGVPILLVGPPAFQRSWSLGRPFAALAPRVDLTSELSLPEVEANLARLRAPRP